MAGRIVTEEQVTKALLSKLVECEWDIIEYDFPQSGSGKMLHINGCSSEKNKDGIIPDIVAVKNGLGLFFENKNRVVKSDYHKIYSLINNNQYSDAIAALFKGYSIEKIFYGVGFPSIKWNKKAASNSVLVDFVAGVKEDREIEFLYNPYNISF